MNYYYKVFNYENSNRDAIMIPVGKKTKVVSVDGISDFPIKYIESALRDEHVSFTGGKPSSFLIHKCIWNIFEWGNNG